jgi:hypothetical protein
MLRRHFERNRALSTFDWATVRPRNVQLLFEAWGGLDEDTQARMIEEFRQISLLATPTGKIQIIDEAMFHGKQQEVAAQLEKLNGLYECAYWTFFEHHECWNGAVRFAQSDGKSRRYWRKRVNMPQLGRVSTIADGEALASAIVDLFRRKEARGQHCVVEQYRRGDREYYFAYPQDHRQTILEYDTTGKMTRRPHRPAFEIIFIHDDHQRTLSVWHEGRRDRIQDLQLAFARAVIGQAIPAISPRDDRVYDLDVLLDPNFVFRPRPELGIARAEVRQMSIQVLGAQYCTLMADLGAHTVGHVLHTRLCAMLEGTPRSMLRVARVRIRVEFEKSSDQNEEERLRASTFELGTPNFCNIKDDNRGLLIQRMLEDHGIELRQPLKESQDGSQTI